MMKPIKRVPSYVMEGGYKASQPPVSSAPETGMDEGEDVTRPTEKGDEPSDVATLVESISVSEAKEMLPLLQAKIDAAEGEGGGESAPDQESGAEDMAEDEEENA